MLKVSSILLLELQRHRNGCININFNIYNSIFSIKCPTLTSCENNIFDKRRGKTLLEKKKRINFFARSIHQYRASSITRSLQENIVSNRDTLTLETPTDSSTLPSPSPPSSRIHTEAARNRRRALVVVVVVVSYGKEGPGGG